MQLKTNKGSTLSQNDYLTIGDYLFAVSPSQPYGFCLVLASDGDLQFFYGATQNPQLGTGPTFRYSSILQDWASEIYKAPGFQPGQASSYFAVMQSDGNFCVYKGTGPADNQGFCWSTNTYGKSTAPYAAMLYTDGNFHVGGNFRSGAITDFWKTNMLYPSRRVVAGDRLASGQWLAAGDALAAGPAASGSGYAYLAWMQGSDLTLGCSTPPGRPVHLPPGSQGGSDNQMYWSAVTNCPGSVYGRNLGGGMYAIMQNDGNFCLYNGTDPGHPGPVYWAISNQAKAQGNYLAQLHADGSLTVGYQDVALPNYWTSVQGTSLIIDVMSGAGQTVHVNGAYDVVQYQDPLIVKVTYPTLVPVAGVPVQFGQWASTLGEVSVYYAPINSLENCSITVTTDNTGTAGVRMWGQSALGGSDQPGSVTLTINVAAFGGFPGAGNGAIEQYVWMDGQ